MDEIKAVLFDYDGVVGIEPRGIFTTSRYLAEKTKLPYEDILAAYLEFVPQLEVGRVTEADIWEEFCMKAGGDIDIKLLTPAFKASMLNKEILSIAKQLKKSGIKCGIITSNSKMRTDVLTEKHKLDELFSPIVCGAVVGAAKSGKFGRVDIFEAALKKLKLSPEQCIFIDNNAANLEIPEAMGFHTYHHDAELNDILALKIYLSGFRLLI